MELNNHFNWKNIEGFFNYHFIYDKIIRKSNQFDIIVEVGCGYGKSTAYLISRAKFAGKNPKVLCVDDFNKNISEFVKNLTKAGVIDCVNIIKNKKNPAIEKINKESIFAAIIENNYKDPSMTNNIKKWFSKIKKEGIIAICDLYNESENIKKYLKNAGIKKFEKHENQECTIWFAKKS
jgi:predicted O-methyltransferase YrrM